MAGVFLHSFNSFCTFLQQAAIWKLELEGTSHKVGERSLKFALLEVRLFQTKKLSENFWS